ncbi:MAG: tetratricopeptide repeat protein [Desulfobacter sp.]|nr:MAG: tetratricopeptide repeat protein [Desulfobacter sp.]
MKKTSLWILISILPLFLSNGCVQGTATTSPQGQDSLSAGPDGFQSDPDENLTAPYFYLIARTHVNKGNLDLAERALETAIKKDEASSFLKRELIRILQARKKTDQAMALAEALAQAAPDDVENLLLLARLKKGNDPELSTILKQILKIDPENKETFLRLGKIYMDMENVTEALSLFKKMVKVFPDYYVARFYLGEALLMTGQPAKAEQAFLETLELEPELVEPRFKLIDIYQTTDPKKYQKKIIDNFHMVLETEPGNERAALELALFHYKAQNMKKADPLFTQMGQELKENPRLVMTAVDILITRKRYEDAVIVFSQLRQADPANTNLNFFLGMAHEALDHKDQAIEYYLKVTPDHPQYKKTILSIAFLYRDKGNIDEALQFLEQHHQQSPADIDILSYLASFYEDAARYNTAMTLLQRGLKTSPDNTTLLFKLGAIQDKAGLRQDCIKTMKSLIRLDPEHASALNYLGYTYAEMGILLDEALDLVKRAMKIRPDDGYITDSLGWVYYQKKEYEQAVVYLEKAARISNFETIIAAHLGDAYEKTGKLKKAMTAYQQALANAKKDQQEQVKAIKEKIKRLEKRADE